MEKVFVTKPYLPNRERFDYYLNSIYESNQLSNNGPLCRLLTSRLEEYLGVKNLLLVSNGTIALQIAHTVFGLTHGDQVITTPFTFAATAHSLRWQGIQPYFCDIDELSWCIDPKLLKNSITSDTKAILPVHVFGNSCNVSEIEKIANEGGIPVIYDASHSFGVKINGESVLNFGDASTLSFHATKLFHTAEGGAIIFKDREKYELAKNLINFGINENQDIQHVGINAKMSELQAAMGLANLDEIEDNLVRREEVWGYYRDNLCNEYQIPKFKSGQQKNYAYFPILFDTENQLLKLLKKFGENDIFPRRYFFPSLDTIASYSSSKACDISQDISKRILCLPIYSSLLQQQQDKILKILKN